MKTEKAPPHKREKKPNNLSPEIQIVLKQLGFIGIDEDLAKSVFDYGAIYSVSTGRTMLCETSYPYRCKFLTLSPDQIKESIKEAKIEQGKPTSVPENLLDLHNAQSAWYSDITSWIPCGRYLTTQLFYELTRKK